MFTYTTSLPRNYTNSYYALSRVRQISRDTKENPPYSLDDSEWYEILEDTKLGNYYQPYYAVYVAISTNPDRMVSISDATGSYSFSDLEEVKKSLLKQQYRLNVTLGIIQPQANSIPVLVSW